MMKMINIPCKNDTTKITFFNRKHYSQSTDVGKVFFIIIFKYVYLYIYISYYIYVDLRITLNII